MKINQVIESTTSGSIATVPSGGGQILSRTGVYDANTKVGSLLKGKKTKKPFANSVSENKKKSKPVKEAELQEDDLIIIPGQGMRRRTGLVSRDMDKGENEGETLKNSLHTIIRVATHLNDALSEQDNFPEWVSEKIGAVKSMMTGVMDYLISDKEMHGRISANEMTGGVVAGGVAFENQERKIRYNDEDDWMDAVQKLNQKVFNEEGDFILTNTGYALQIYGKTVAVWDGEVDSGWVIK